MIRQRTCGKEENGDELKTLPDELGPVADRKEKVPGMDKVKRVLLICPWFLYVINFELAIGWNPWRLFVN